MTIWDQPKENSLAALLHGMQIADGIEFDLRISSDGDFVVYHNELVPGEGDKSERSIERMSTSELRSLGIATFDELLSQKVLTDVWQAGGKTANIEFKVPHPAARIDDVDAHLSAMMGLLEESLAPFDLPARSALVYSFSPRIGSVAKSVGFEFPVTRLSPYLRPWGSYRIKRLIGTPGFVLSTVTGLIKEHRKEGMPAVAMALKYLQGWERFAHPGAPMAISGGGLERLNRARAGMGLHVWPAPLELETSMLEAGISLISDHMDPSIFSLPDGKARWMRPASQPLDDEWRERLDVASDSERGDLIREAGESLPTWPEIGSRRKREMVTEQGNRMFWAGSEDKWIAEAENGLPWGSPRLIGHRGAGDTD